MTSHRDIIVEESIFEIIEQQQNCVCMWPSVLSSVIFTFSTKIHTQNYVEPSVQFPFMLLFVPPRTGPRLSWFKCCCYPVLDIPKTQVYTYNKETVQLGWSSTWNGSQHQPWFPSFSSISVLFPLFYPFSPFCPFSFLFFRLSLIRFCYIHWLFTKRYMVLDLVVQDGMTDYMICLKLRIYFHVKLMVMSG